MCDNREDPSVTRFREYLQVKSVQPNPDYKGCVELLTRLYGDIGMSIQVMEICLGKPILWFTKKGSNPSLPSILLNSHMDVVPVNENKWKSNPFGGEKDSDGNIYGRGAQDMKCVGIMAMEALSRLSSTPLLRTVHVSFVPDEEIGGEDGMKAWVQTDNFRKLNVGVALDESVPMPLPSIIVFTSERSKWTAQVKCCGEAGHGSLFVTNSAVEKMTRLLSHIQEYRQIEEVRYKENAKANWPNFVTTINLTMIHGGKHHNVIPDKIKLTFDCRLAPTLDFQKFEQWFEDICRKAGDGVTVQFSQKEPKCETSPTDPSSPFWATLKSTTDAMNISLFPMTCPGTTDARFIRQVGIAAYGFTPITNTPCLVHNHNEFVAEDKFIRGIDIFKQVIGALASIPPSS